MNSNGTLARAIDAAEDRKRSALGEPETSDPILMVSGSKLREQLIFSGFDIDVDELIQTSTIASLHFTNWARTYGLVTLFSSAWTDGLLVGLMAAEIARIQTTDEPATT
jgi:hypothetical protein